jgi:UDP:flavonoid glycosyltransferase YjiC (YdhE family)
MVESPWLNLSVYPEEADYRRLRPLGPTWHRLPSLADSAARGDAWRPPPGGRDVPVVHLALGSLGSSDLDLMQRLLDTLDGAAVRVIAETGPLHEQLTLPANAAGEPFLPLSLALPHADLVITSGGNHAVTEALHHGKPLIVLPLFGEQHDNAQRVAETGLGVRLAYGFRERELLEAIGLLQGDRAMGRRIADVAARAQATDGVRLAAELIERVAVGRDQPAHALT